MKGALMAKAASIIGVAMAQRAGQNAPRAAKNKRRTGSHLQARNTALNGGKLASALIIRLGNKQSGSAYRKKRRAKIENSGEMAWLSIEKSLAKMAAAGSVSSLASKA
jgi:hypothetical protein